MAARIDTGVCTRVEKLKRCETFKNKLHHAIKDMAIASSKSDIYSTVLLYLSRDPLQMAVRLKVVKPTYLNPDLHVMCDVHVVIMLH